MRLYTIVDKTTGEETEANADTVERILGVEISYIDWLLEQDGKFENGDWEVRVKMIFAVSSQRSSDPIGTEDLFAKWNRTR